MAFDLISYHRLFLLHHSASVLSLECARLFHAAGAQLILCGRDQKRLQEVVDELTAIPRGKMKVKILLVYLCTQHAYHCPLDWICFFFRLILPALSPLTSPTHIWLPGLRRTF